MSKELSARSRLAIIIVCGLAVIFDGYDLVVYGTTLPTMMAEWQLSPKQAGAIGSYALMGMLIGAMLIGALAAQFGRKRLFILCVVWFSLFTVLCAFAPDPATFGLFRFAAGLGLGGLMPMAASIVMDVADAKRRYLTYVIMQSGFAVGGVLAASLAIPVLQHSSWHLMYLIGGLPLLTIVPLAIWLFPRSIDHSLSGDELARQAAQAPGERLRQQLGGLFAPGLGGPTLLFWGATFCALLLVYGLNTWLPQIMRTAGYSLGSALSFLLVFNLGSIVGALLAGRVADRVGPKRVIVASFLLAVAAIGLLTSHPPTAVLYVLIAIGGYGAIGTQHLVNAFVTGYYPGAVRATGIGFSLGVGRLGAILGPILGGFIAASGAHWTVNFAFFAVVAACGALAIAGVDARKAAIRN